MRILAALLIGLLTSAAGVPFLGVTTQFGREWPDRAWLLVPPSHIMLIRDSISWRAAEPQRGRSEADAASAHIARACRSGRRVLIVLNPHNPAYDGGRFAASADAQQAFGRFAAAIADRYGDCIAAFEIGNEVNARGAIDGDAASHPILTYVSLVRAVRDAVKERHPGLTILGGSSNTVAIGFQQRLFDAGLLAVVDGIAIHPYRHDPANVDWEVERLRDAMRHAGRPVPIWATEFSSGSADPDETARVLVKTSLLLASAGVVQAGWYALIDQPRFPNMGLFGRDGATKPAALAFDQLARVLTGPGQVIRRPSDPGLYWFRLASGTQVMWGAPRPLRITGAMSVRDVTGAPIAAPDAVSESPIFVDGGHIAIGAATVVADSLDSFGRRPWSYVASQPDRAAMPLTPVEGNWTSYLANRGLPGIAVTQTSINIAPTPAPTTVRLRYTTDHAVTGFAAACVKPGAGRAMTFAVTLPRRAAALRQVAGEARIVMPLHLEAGQSADFDLIAKPAIATAAAYRIRIVTTPRAAPVC